ncbi:hypothetical protein FOMPIDRAFT_1052763 [Fomitopsis schrenkii]|uniref:Uncharacterized protein n=1 Tax=Fomitopsis schrenkii TaxID=2126942 RepID=S8DV88_FOMSC|nr:hypothetical protein FOMPIDRAFT_1052763 [Fomitopsis schrenkii]
MPPTPASIISDALTSLSKATNLALSTVEEQARTDVVRACAEAAEARRERDDALKILRDLKVEEKEWERREEAWKASVDKAELKIKHQAETISHLRAESAQWKAQLTRLEEASREEITDWKERCLRADEERCRLSSRIDELVAEQLAYNTQANAAMGALASRSPYPDLFEHSSSSTKRASTSSVHPPLSKRQASLVQAPDNNPPPSPVKSKPKQTPSKQLSHTQDAPPARTPKHKPPVSEHPTSSTKTQRTPNTPRTTSSTRAAPRAQPQTQARPQPQPEPSGPVQQRVIRRVKAVISVPVKEEEESDADPFEDSDASGSAYEPEEEQPMRKRTSGRASIGGRRRSQASRVVDEEDEEDDEEEDAPKYRHTRRPRYISEDEDDTDELAMRPNDDYEDTPKKTLKANTARLSASASAKKRKLDTEQASGTTGRATNTKVARKR